MTEEPSLELKSALYLCKSILTKMQQISDAPRWMPRVDAKARRRAARFENQPVPSSDTVGGVPSKMFSLWAHYNVRMNRAAQERDTAKLTLLAACAMRDYDLAGMRRQRERPRSHNQAVDELIGEYVGCLPLEAALYLGTSEKWVRRQRVLSGRDPDYGHERETDPITATILRMSANGASERAIASETGLSKSAVHRRLEAAQAA